MLAEVGRVGVAPTVFLMYLIKSQVLKCRPRLTIPMEKNKPVRIRACYIL